MTDFRLICDTRERQSTLGLFPKHDLIEIRQLTIGDYAICRGDKIIFLFERKTWEDLSSSIVDERLERQTRNMFEMNCRCMFIIEGKLGFQDNTLIGGIEFHKIDAMRRHLIMLGFEIIQTADPAHTVKFLVKFFEQFINYLKKDKIIQSLYLDESEEKIDDKSTVIMPPTGEMETKEKKWGGKFKTDTVGRLTEKRERTDAEIVAEILSQLPGVGRTTLESIRKYSIVELIGMTIEQLSEIRTNNRKFGIKAAEKVYGMLHGEISAVPLMERFPKISKKSAEYIFKSCTFIQFATTDMSDVMKSEKSRVGTICAETISRLCNFKNLT